MSEFDRYGAPPQQPGAFEHDLHTPPKTSGFAIASVIFSLLIVCPVVSQLLGIMFGVVGLLSVASSNGRKKGAGLAIAGIVISVITGAVTAWGVYRAYDWFDEMILQPPGMFMAAVDQQDFPTARTTLSAAANTAATDEDFAAFHALITDRYGTFVDWQPGEQTGGPMAVQSTTGSQFDFPGVMSFNDPVTGASTQVDAIVTFSQVGTRAEYRIDSITLYHAAGERIVFPPGGTVPPPGGLPGDMPPGLPAPDAEGSEIEPAPGGPVPGGTPGEGG